MAKRTDIRQFQAQLAQALQAAQQGKGQEGARWLAVLAGRHRVLLPLAETAGVIHEFALHSVPFAPAAYRGVTNVRGELYDVVDLAVAVGATPTALTSSARLVLAASAIAPRLALLATQVMGLRRVTDLRPEPAAADETAPRFSDENGNLWQEVAVRSLLEDVVRTFMTPHLFTEVAP